MPFIRGRYHINPVMGEALEAAREAEAAMLALEEEARQGGDASDDGSRAGDQGKAPIHRVEIEAAEMVRPQSGRAERGFVARVHRQPPARDMNASEDDDILGVPAQRMTSRGSMGTFETRRNPMTSSASGEQRYQKGQQAETHVFSTHGDLLNFLRDELARDCDK